jgi:aryl-alcohol dehydrogenase-like predicted oxidoreductase
MYNASLASKVLGKTGLTVSRLGLGTAELGFAYGVGPREVPSEEDALKLLQAAVELGITFFDTANYYGLAEERIGKSGILKNPNVIVCTKCAQFLEKGEVLAPAEIEQKITEQVESSIRMLGVEALTILLLHGPSAEQVEEGLLGAIVERLKKEGKILFSGASTRGEEAPLALMRSSWADIIQVAFNIADQRMVPRVFAEAQKEGIGVINRSVYLKGAFAGREEYLPGALKPLKSIVSAAQKIADDLHIPLAELALRYTLSEPAIGVSLVGTSKLQHLGSTAHALNRGPLPADIVASLRALSISDPSQVDPARWPKE